MDRRQILKVENAILTAGRRHFRDALSAEIDLGGGELFLLRLEHPVEAIAIADLCCGLLPPQQGQVLFLGRDWAGLRPDLANALRGRIGRVFSRGAWLGSLTVRENILLAQLHHTPRPVCEVQDEAAQLCREMGLPGLPTGYPAAFSRADLQRAAWTRAFLGAPNLLLLEEPTAGISEMDLGPFVNAVRKARDRGAAVVWMTRAGRLWQDPAIAANRRFRIVGRRLIEVTRK